MPAGTVFRLISWVVLWVTPHQDTGHSSTFDATASLEATIRDRDQQIAALKKRKEEERGRADAMEREFRAVDAERKENKKQATDLQAQLQTRDNALQTRCSELEAHNGSLTKQIDELRKEVAAVDRNRQLTTNLLETQSNELRQAQAYLTLVDDISISDRDVQRMVENINSVIFQTAAKLAEAFESRYDVYTVVADQARGRVEAAGFLSCYLVHALQVFRHSRDSVVVQTALQATMVANSGWLGSTWDFNRGRTGDLKCEDVYERIRAQQPQSVSGRWRALSRMHIKEILLGGEAERQDFFADRLGKSLTDILLASGVQASPDDLLDEVSRLSKSALQDVIELTLDIQRITGERIVSRDLMIGGPSPGMKFSHECMTDAWDKDSKGTQMGGVLCTMQLGLFREETGSFEGEDGHRRLEVSRAVLLKPEVMLESMLEVLWDEQVEAERREAK